MKTQTQLLEETKDMLSFRRAVEIAHYIHETRDVPGDIAELGCYRGHTAAFMAALTDKRMWLFDSFEGLPDRQSWEVTRGDFVKGYLKASPEDVGDTFKSAGLPLPTICKCWFSDIILASDYNKAFPEWEWIAFAHIDGDFYTSTRDAIVAADSRMVAGGVAIVDDYQNPDLPGVERAVNEFLDFHPRVGSKITVPKEQIALFWK